MTETNIHQETLMLRELKQLLIRNYDLIQWQEALLLEKDKKLHSLQQENDSVRVNLMSMNRIVKNTSTLFFN